MFLGSSLVFAAVADEPAGEPALERCFREPATVVRTLPPEVVWATDVRWVDDHRVVLASNVFGIFELDLGDASVPPKRIVEAGPRKSAAWAPTAVAISKEHVAWAAVAFAIGWMPLGDEEALVPIGREYFEMASDLDLRGQKVAVLGLRKSEVPRSYEANGAFVWTGTLGDEGLTDLRHLAFAGDGAPAQQLNDCMNFHFGDLRFLGDGSLVAVPISEPGVFLFAPDGTLRRTWTSDELDIHGGCKLTMREADDLAISPEMRKDWINQRRLVDDVVPFGNGDFGLLIREYDAGTTHWTLLRLSADGSERQQCLLHEEPDGAWIRLEADYHDGKLVLLRRPKFESKRAIREGSQEPTVLWVGRYE